MAVDEPDAVRSDFCRLLDHQLVLIERMVNHLQMGHPDPASVNDTKSLGKFGFLSRSFRLFNSYSVSPPDKSPDDLADLMSRVSLSQKPPVRIPYLMVRHPL